jgi:hypothetical protein
VHKLSHIEEPGVWCFLPIKGVKLMSFRVNECSYDKFWQLMRAKTENRLVFNVKLGYLGLHVVFISFHFHSFSRVNMCQFLSAQKI